MAKRKGKVLGKSQNAALKVRGMCVRGRCREVTAIRIHTVVCFYFKAKALAGRGIGAVCYVFVVVWLGLCRNTFKVATSRLVHRKKFSLNYSSSVFCNPY